MPTNYFKAIQPCWHCELKLCHYYSVTCFIYGRRHYPITVNNLKLWNSRIIYGEATIYVPPLLIHPMPAVKSKKWKNNGFSSDPEESIYHCKYQSNINVHIYNEVQSHRILFTYRPQILYCLHKGIHFRQVPHSMWIVKITKIWWLNKSYWQNMSPGTSLNCLGIWMHFWGPWTHWRSPASSNKLKNSPQIHEKVPIGIALTDEIWVFSKHKCMNGKYALNLC